MTQNAPALDNPMGTDGFEFVEYTAPDPQLLGRAVRAAGLHRRGAAPLEGRGALPAGRDQLHREPRARQLRAVLRARARPVGVRVRDPREGRRARPTQRALDLGAKPFHGKVGPMELNIPAIQGIGGSLIYLVDRYPGNNGTLSIYDVDFVPARGRRARAARRGTDRASTTSRTTCTRGAWTCGRSSTRSCSTSARSATSTSRASKTGLTSRALTSPCGKIRIPINEPSDHKSQIQEYLDAYHGEGIQHIALVDRRHLRDGRDAARARGALPRHARRLLRARRRARARTTARTSRA